MSRARQRQAPADRVVDRVQAGGARLPDRLHGGGVGRVGRLQVAGEVEDQVVQVGQQLVRRQIDVGERTDRGAQPAHAGRGVQSVADDVADDQCHPRAGQGNDVEPVAADLGAGARGQIAGGDLDRLLVRQALQQQAALQGQRGGALAGVPAGIVDGYGGLGRQFLGQDQVVRGERLGPLGAGEGHHSQQRPACAQRHGDAAGQPVRGEGGVDQRIARRPVRGISGEPGAEGPFTTGSGLLGELDHGGARGHAASGDGVGGERDRLPSASARVLVGAVPSGAAEPEGVPARESRRRGRFLAAQHLLPQIHGDEVGEPGHGTHGQLPGRSDDVERPADVSARLVEDEQPLPGPVLGAHVETPVGDGADLALGVADGPDAGGPGVGVVAAQRAEDGDETRGPTGPRHLGELVGVGLVVPFGEQRAVELGQHLAVVPAQHLLLGVCDDPARGGVDPQESQFGVVDAQCEGTLLEGPVGDDRPAVPALDGHHVTLYESVGAAQRLCRHHGVHRVPVPVPQGYGPGGGGVVALGEPGRRWRGQQVGHGPPDDVVRRPAQQPTPSLAPAADPAVRTDHDDGGRSVLVVGRCHAPHLRPDIGACRGWLPAAFPA